MHHASKTFMMDETLGCARVKVQFGDDEKRIEVFIRFQISCLLCVDMNILMHVDPHSSDTWYIGINRKWH